jgi:hypothetical protein
LCFPRETIYIYKNTEYIGKWHKGVREGKVQIALIEGEQRAMMSLESEGDNQETKLLQQHLIPPFFTPFAWNQKITSEF